MQIEKETQDINILFSVARLANFDGKGVELIFSVLNNTILPNNIPMNEMSFEIACDACADVGYWHEAKDLLQLMTMKAHEDDGICPFPTSNVFHPVLRAFQNGEINGLWCEGTSESLDEVLEAMLLNNINVDPNLLINDWEDEELFEDEEKDMKNVED